MTTTTTPPELASVDALLANADPAVVAAATARYAAIHAAFVARFGSAPRFFARSPGRVNIIGEHIDYCGYSVMPMAIARDVIIAVAPAADEDDAAPKKVTVVNINPAKYPDHTFVHSSSDIVEIDSSVHAWTNYFKCGYKGAFQVLLEDSVSDAANGRSLNILIDGNVPAGAGVSSSSALVCASALATLTAFDHAIDKVRLTETAIRSERFAGVQTGGMDQSISIMGTADSALLIHFFPKLSADPMRFPKSDTPFVFVIANTLVTADKHTTAPTNYNLRVVETRLAAALLAAKYLSASHPYRKHGAPERITLRDFHSEWLKEGNEVAGESEADTLRRLEALAASAFHDEPYTKAEVATELGITEDVLDQIFIGSIVIRYDGLRIKKRAVHAFSEARRVFEFRDVCALKAPYTGDLLKDLGDLMNASQKSCREDFNCSCAEIDELTAIARSAGAYGSRLTGAGWGGCTVSLVPEPILGKFIETVTEEYYYKKNPALRENPNRATLLADWIFASKPSAGAAVLRGLSF
ncbi:ribosomal protein S5 domain 2-type protein [Zopfochytrium polystomum]|nr:ribosomal protein S5 domain 2-type protein [Zopfochytrium polystomum]